MNLYEKIIKIYPELESHDMLENGIELRNDSDGRGDYIEKWNHLSLERPTEEQLNAIEE